MPTRRKKGRVETALHAIKDAGGIQAKPEKSLKSIQARQMQVKPAKESFQQRGCETKSVQRERGKERRIRLEGFALGNGPAARNLFQ